MTSDSATRRQRVRIAIFLTLSTLFCWNSASAREDGITGLSISGCDGCHSGGAVPTVMINGPGSVTVGNTATFTLTVMGGSGVTCGLDVSATLGALSTNDAGTQLLNSEITHLAPRAFSSGSCSFDFDWTAPDVAGSPTATLRGAGNSTNGNGFSSGDQGATTNLAVSVTGGASVDISANPPVISAGETTTLTWSTQNATSCEAFGDWSGIKAAGTDVTEVVTPSAGANSYGLTCFGSIGTASAQDQVSVTAIESLPSFPISVVSIGNATAPQGVSAGGGGIVHLYAQVPIGSGVGSGGVSSSALGVNLLPPTTMPAIRSVDLDGNLATFAPVSMSNPPVVAAASGNVYYFSTQQSGFNTLNHLHRREPNGTTTRVSDPLSGMNLQPGFRLGNMVLDEAENVYWLVPTYVGPAPDNGVLKITPAGAVESLIDENDGTHFVYDLAVDSEGGLYISNRFPDELIYRSPTGEVSVPLTAAGDGVESLATANSVVVDSFDNAYVAGLASDNVFRVTPDGDVSVAISKTQLGASVFDEPFDLEADPHGNVYVLARASKTVWRIRPDGQQDFLLDASGDGVTAFGTARAMTVDRMGNVYVIDASSVFRIATGVEVIIDDSGDGIAALDEPSSVDASGDAVFVAGAQSDNVFQIEGGGAPMEILPSTGGGAGAFSGPEALAQNGADVYVGNASTNALTRITSPGNAVAVAAPGAPTNEIVRDGSGGLVYGVGDELVRIDAAGSVTMSTVTGLAAGAAIGAIAPIGDGPFAAGAGQDLVRIEADGVTSSVLYDAPGGAGIVTVRGLAVDSDGAVYAVSSEEQKVVRIAGGPAETLLDVNGDGFNALGTPEDVAVDAEGNVFVVDGANDRVFRIEPGGDIDVVLSPSGDGITAATQLEHVVVGGDGSAYVTARGSDAVFAIRPIPEVGAALANGVALLTLAVARARRAASRSRTRN